MSYSFDWEVLDKIDHELRRIKLKYNSLSLDDEDIMVMTEIEIALLNCRYNILKVLGLKAMREANEYYKNARSDKN